MEELANLIVQLAIEAAVAAAVPEAVPAAETALENCVLVCLLRDFETTGLWAHQFYQITVLSSSCSCTSVGLLQSRHKD